MNTLVLRNRFPYVVAVTLAAAVVLGFLRTYYLRFLSDLPPMSQLVHVHGLLCTAWIALHVTQARLIAVRRVQWHMRLGIFTALVGVLIVVTSFMVSMNAAASGHAPRGADPVRFLAVSLGTTFMFALFLVAAVSMRRHADWHKRLMLLTTLVFLVPAIGRIGGLATQALGTPPGLIPFAVTLAFVIWACKNDLRRTGTIHNAYLFGGTILLAAIPLRAWLAGTETWQPVAEALVDWWRTLS
jgi:hypothetical protein